LHKGLFDLTPNDRLIKQSQVQIVWQFVVLLTQNTTLAIKLISGPKLLFVVVTQVLISPSKCMKSRG